MSTPTPPSTTPSLETQLDFLVHEMGTGNGGSLITNNSWNSGNLSVEGAATLFENRFERAGGSNLNGRINYTNQVYNAAQNGTLGSISSNVRSSYNYLISRGFNPAQASGIVGNLMAESGIGLDPAAFNSAGGGQGAFGIAQWRADRQSNLLNWDGEAIIPSEDFVPDDTTPLVNSPEDASELTGNEGNFNTGGGQSLYEDNVLNSFDSYTYSWAIHMVNPQTAQDFEENLNRNTYITLAESGVENEISIEHVIQSNTLNFVHQNRSSVANTFDITLVEAKGFTLFNRIILAAQDLGIENHTEAAYLLELNFRGWDESGTPVNEIVGPYYYMTTITDFKTRHSDSATTYQVAFAETHQEAFNRLEYHLRSDITVTASNFGAFLTDFEQKVNNEAVKQTALTLSKLYPTLYVFGTEGEASTWESWDFDAIIGSEIQESRNISMSASGGTITFNFKAGTAITAGIAAAVLQTRNFKQIPVANGQFAKDNPDAGTANATRLAEMINWFSFTTEVEYKEFDPLSRQYQKQITYNIQPYIAFEGLHDPISFSELNTSRTLQTTRLDNILRNGFLKKRFDYTYTGLNTEVLNLDLTFNNTFFSLQPINGGAIEGAGGYFDGLTTTEANAVRARNEFRAVQDQIRSLNRRLGEIDNEREAALSRRDMGDLDIITRLESERNIILSRRQSLTTQLINNSETAFDTTQELAEQSRNAQGNSLTPTAQQYITQSDVFAGSQYQDSIARSMNFDYRSVRDSLAASGADLSDNVGTAMLGALELNLNAVESMVNQRIDIRGDPYWLGRPKGVSVSNTNQANYSRGGVGYFLHVRFPTYEGEDGFIDQSFTNFTITALFRVLTVTSTYSMGEFKQTLTSFRDVSTNVPMMIEQLLSGKISNPGRRNLQQQYTDNDGDGIDDTTGEEIPEDNSTEIDPNARGNDSGSVSGDTDGLRPELMDALDQAATETGVTAVVTSGVRDGGSNPSGRHNGSAADVALYSDGRLLSVENPADLAIIQNYTQAYLDATTSAGLTPSVGIANPAYGSGSSIYMSGTSFHYDISRTPGYSSAATNPAAGPYWGGSGSTAHHSPPSWLVDMYNN